MTESLRKGNTESESGMIDGLAVRSGRGIPVIVGGISGGMTCRSSEASR
jgi:hypothetical protein